MKDVFLALLILFLLGGCYEQPAQAQLDPYDSGGPLMPEQAAYDVQYYALDVSVSPSDSSISGSVRTIAHVHSPIDWFVVDLDPRLDILQASEHGSPDRLLKVDRRGGRVWIKLPFSKQPGTLLDVDIEYGGRPRIAPNPPWSGGLTWDRTPSGAPWIATTCQTIGADVWWPVKDHVSDEPDSMSIRVTVPEDLVVASNGRLRGRTERAGQATYDWFVSNPINVYNVALNIAPYELIESSYESVSGEIVPIQFFVLPENLEDGQAMMPEIIDHLNFFEEYLGPYPFRADKYGVAQTPHLGMEHQTIIAYGAGFRNESMTGGTDWGFDALHHHELSHEWWGNLVTNSDWADMWLHEGFGSYMQPLYLEARQGPEQYAAYLQRSRRGIRNDQPVAPRGSMTSQEIYTGDIYSKGAWILHTLRFLIGDEAFFQSLRRMAYPDPAMEAITDGSQTRFATSDDFRGIAEEAAGKDLGWFFEVYLRQRDLPELEIRESGDRLELSWQTPDDLPFPMPVEVRIGEVTERVDLTDGTASIRIPEGVPFEVDPNDRVLRVGN